LIRVTDRLGFAYNFCREQKCFAPNLSSILLKDKSACRTLLALDAR
jgi:hypothetical protein